MNDSTATPTADAPTTAPPAVPVEPHSHAGLSPTEATTMAEWVKDDLAKGKISLEEATKRFDALGATPEQRAADTRSDEVKLLDQHFPPAKEGEFLIQWYPPGRAPAVIPKEVQVLDANVRAWMSGMGLSREQGTTMVKLVADAKRSTQPMSPNELESHKDNENAKLDKLFGPDWQDKKLPPVKRMIHELDQKRPGLKEFVRAHGNNALLITELIKAARIYDARKGR